MLYSFCSDLIFFLSSCFPLKGPLSHILPKVLFQERIITKLSDELLRYFLDHLGLPYSLSSNTKDKGMVGQDNIEIL